MVRLKGRINGGITCPYLVGDGATGKKMEYSFISVRTGMAFRIIATTTRHIVGQAVSSGKTVMQNLEKDVFGWSNVERGVIVLPKASPRQGSGKDVIPIKLGVNSVKTVICGMENLVKILDGGGWECSNGSNVGGE